MECGYCVEVLGAVWVVGRVEVVLPVMGCLVLGCVHDGGLRCWDITPT